MSEYRYYEWQAVDRPLTAAEQGEVEALSSHIAVTATRAWVDYHWGEGFRHDPIEVLARYFDAFMSFANRGGQRLAFRIPGGLLNDAELQPYQAASCVELTQTGMGLVLAVACAEADESAALEVRGDLAELVPLREEILQGDYRSLYLAWLRAAASASPAATGLEPPVPAGLAELTPAQSAFCAFLQLDEALVQAAAAASPALHPLPAVAPEQALARLSADERDAFLLRLARGEPHLSLSLNRRLQQLVKAPHQPPAAPTRTWHDLRQQADARISRVPGT